jgi:response regulator RpfG family c-di-GMP phosphodiesterase
MLRNDVKTVLLVDDDVKLRSIVARHLRRSGLEVTEHEGAEEAMSDMARRDVQFDVAISDVHLPGMSGLDLASVLLGRRPSQPIVVITGDLDEALRRDALSRGPVSYLLKPFKLPQLDAMVAQALMRHEVPPDFNSAEGEPTGRIPQDWLDVIDQQAFAGPGHARRVGQLSLALLETLPDTTGPMQVSDLLTAAWAHELGRLTAATSDPIVVAGAGSRMLAGLGCAPAIVEGVRHMHERFDGSGGPLALAGAQIPMISQILAVADSLEHFASAWIQAGKDADGAVARALSLVVDQSGSVFSPIVVSAAQRQHPQIVRICGDRRPRLSLVTEEV